MADADELKRMISSFRVSELQLLCGYAGKSRSGRKSDLLARALPIAEKPTQYLTTKVMELYRKRITCGLQTPVQLTTPVSLQPSGLIGVGPSFLDNLDISSAYSPVSTPPMLNLIPLPFYDKLDTLLAPQILVPLTSSRFQDKSMLFHLAPQHIQEINNTSRDARTGESTVQVQLRLCSVVDGVEEQEDCFPPNICVRANGKVATLPNPIPTNKPNMEPKRPPRPVNITSLCRLMPQSHPNQVSVSWTHEVGRSFCCAIYLVRKVTSQILLKRLQDRGLQPVEETVSLIKAKLVLDDDVIATTGLRASLVCPLGKMRQALPCRSSNCNHVQCFDAMTFLMMNEKKASWQCPVCDGPATFKSLRLDGLFADLVKKCTDSDEVVFTEDGNWRSYKEGEDDDVVQSVGAAATDAVGATAMAMALIAPPRVVKADPEGQQEVVDLTLDSSDDDDDDDATREADDEPPCKRQLLTTGSANISRSLLPAGVGFGNSCSSSSSSGGSSSSSSGCAAASSGSSVLSMPSVASVTTGPCLQRIPQYPSFVDAYMGVGDYALTLASRGLHGATVAPSALLGSTHQQPLALSAYTLTSNDMFDTFGIAFDHYDSQPQDLSNKGHANRLSGSTNSLLSIGSVPPTNASIPRAPLSHSSYNMVSSHLTFSDDVIPVD